MSEEKEYAENLKAFEAELASLVPRTDRLDRQRLMFLAGQASVAAGHGRPTVYPKRWAWPAAFAAMSTMAATLMVMLLLRPEPPVVFVEVPVEPAGGQAREADRAPESPVRDEGPAEPLPSPPEPSFQRIQEPGLLALLGLNWPRGLGALKLSTEVPYPVLRDRVLARGLDSWTPPVSAQGVERAAAPVSYRQLLDTLLEGLPPDQAVPDHPTIDLNSGANS